jgi:hypothetical protein
MSWVQPPHCPFLYAMKLERKGCEKLESRYVLEEKQGGFFETATVLVVLLLQPQLSRTKMKSHLSFPYASPISTQKKGK